MYSKFKSDLVHWFNDFLILNTQRMNNSRRNFIFLQMYLCDKFIDYKKKKKKHERAKRTFIHLTDIFNCYK